MYKIQSKANANKTSVHALPCKLHHNGPVDSTHFRPTSESDSTSTVYFRGRKLRGRTIDLPKDYQGCVVKKTDRVLPRGVPQASTAEEDADMDDEPPEEVKVMEKTATFDNITIWSHGALPDMEEDAYAKGVQEWIAFAEAIHGKASA